jgi:FHA domain-containing protein
VIENIGSANPIAVRGEPLLHGHSVPLRHRDQLRIGAYLLEAVEEPGDAVPTPAAPRSEPAPGLDAGLWSAFCEGAGLRFEADPGTTAQRLHAAGRLLRHTVAGLLELLCVQPLPPRTPRGGSSGRHALSNPLKVAPDAQAALELLLLPPLRGFLDGPEAMAEALEELLAQASATGAGTRAAREGMLRRFVPASLEDRLAADAAPPWWPAQRQARLWAQYCRHFELLRDQAQADFDALFGQAFVAAYEQRLQALRQAKNG